MALALVGARAADKPFSTSAGTTAARLLIAAHTVSPWR
jgi:hypothetical protein